MNNSEISREDYINLLDHWNNVFSMTEEDDEQSEDKESWRHLAPADKLRDALETMKDCKNVLDYGCGSGWGSIMLAGFGCESVTSADPSFNAVKMTEHYAKYYGFSDRIHPVCVDDSWLSRVEDNAYDGFFCSNVLDVIPTEIAEEILKNAARIVTDDARVIISLNYYMSPEAAEERGITLQNGNMVFM
ncbi:MAG: class I SAM-dependent methyltransferase, partial [Erysipelotrichaceae bacterium]|nr:class I SAM-dependent methyltransferase [Erysipelotrichaceae bacterium]